MRYKSPRNGLGAALLAVALGVSVAACDVVSGRQDAGAYAEDASITAKVKAAFLDDPTVDATRVSVETLDNTVQLSGFVESASAKVRAGELARRVEGVRSVKNDLVVR